MFIKRFIFLVFIMNGVAVFSQCAMCKAVVENGDSDLAEGINSGIIYLMIFPYVFLAIGIYFLVRRYKKHKV